MSEQQEVEDGTSLEEVFNSREFGRASGTAGARSRGVAGIAGVEEIIVTEEFDVATRFAAPVLQGVAGVGLNDPPFEDVLHSARDGRPLTLVSPLPTGDPVGVAMPAENAGVAPIDGRPRERNRYRAVAAVSGIAAAALVVAGVTSGTVQRRPSQVSAQGPRRAALPLGSGSFSRAGIALPGAPTPTATLSAAIGDGSGSSALDSDSPLRPGNASGGQVTISGPPATSGSPLPSPTMPAGGAPTGVSGAPGSPQPPPSAGGSPLTPVTTAVGTTVTAVGTSVTAAADQLGSSIPSTAPAASAVGVVMSGIGQTVASTMG